MKETLKNFDSFIKDKLDFGANNGFQPSFLPDCLFDFQKHITEKSIRRGRSAIFTDCGTGKTVMELVWSENVLRKENKPVLILTPLSVVQQTLDEAVKFGIEAKRATNNKNTTIEVSNYEKLHLLDYSKYGGVVCDESSILKNFDGVYRDQITRFMRQIPYRLLGTATATPNDWEELGTSSEALGYYGYIDMLNKFFTNKNNTTKASHGKYGHDKWVLRGYATEDFWRWVCSWAIAARTPADLGFDNDGFVLPPLIELDTLVETKTLKQGTLFDLEATNFFEEREAIKRTITERCEAASEKVANYKISTVWCHLNEEAKLLKKLIPNSVEISGSDSDTKKEEAISWFCKSKDDKRVLISKPKIFAFGLNFQHCHHATYFPTHSYEQYYQATRRLWRFGQKEKVIIDRIYTDGGKRILKNLNRKALAADKMFSDLVKYMNDTMTLKHDYKETKITIPSWLD